MSDSDTTDEADEPIDFTNLVTYAYWSEQGIWQYEHQILDDWVTWYRDTLAKGNFRVEIVNIEPISAKEAKGLEP